MNLLHCVDHTPATCFGHLFLPSSGRSLTNIYYKDIKTSVLYTGLIPKSLRDFRPLRYSSRDGHAEGEHVNRRRDTPSFRPTL